MRMWSFVFTVVLGGALTIGIQQVPQLVRKMLSEQKVKQISTPQGFHPTREDVDARFRELFFKAGLTLDSSEFAFGLALLRDAYYAGGIWHYLAVHGGLNGVYVQHMIEYSPGANEKKDCYGNQLRELDRWYLGSNPYILAVRETSNNMISILQKKGENKVIGAMACGTMHQFRPEHKIMAHQIYGYDLDPECLIVAQNQCMFVNVEQHNILRGFGRKFDIITCLGLACYVDNDFLFDLFKNFYRHLQPGGFMIVSFIRPRSTWLMELGDREAQDNIEVLNNVLPVRELVTRDYDEIKAVAVKAGFAPGLTKFEPDGREICPLLLAFRERRL